MVSKPLTEPLRPSNNEFPISWYCDLFSHWAFIENLLCVRTWTRFRVEKWVDHELWLQVQKITCTFSDPNRFLVFYYIIPLNVGFPGGSEGKASAHNGGDPCSTPGSRRSPGEGNGNPLQYSCLKNSMDRGAWWATVLRITKSRTWLSNIFTHSFGKFKLA